MMEEKHENEIGKMRKQTSELVDIKIALVKLEVYEKVSMIGASIISGMIVMILILFFITSLFLSFALYLGELFQSFPLGFLLSGAIYLLLLLLFLFLFRRPMKAFIINKTIQLFTSNHEQD
jgi:hypothetical protein